MKNILAIIIGLITIVMSSIAFSYSCGGTVTCASSCEVIRETYCDRYQNACNCADFGYRWNTCISKSEYCEAFGNVGKLD